MSDKLLTITSETELQARLDAARERRRRAVAAETRIVRQARDADRNLRAQRLLAIGSVAWRLAELDPGIRAAILADMRLAGVRPTDQAALAGTILDPAAGAST